MVETVVLHVGPHKTGTTALQSALAANAGLLGRHGVLYPMTGRMADSHAALAEALWRRDAATVAALAAETAGWRVVLISSENLSALDCEALLAIRRVFPGAEFRLSYTLRRLTHLWPSHWKELVKHGQALTFAGYLARVASRDDRPYHAPILPRRQLDRLASVFGEAALRIGLYETRLSEGQDIGPAFIDDMLGIGQAAPQFKTRRQNIAPDELETAMVHLMNHHAEGKLNYPARQQLRKALLAARRRDPPPVWLAPLQEALSSAGRLVLTQDHPMVREEQMAVVDRFGQALQDPVESFIAPVETSVPQLESMRLAPDAQSALIAEIDALIAARTS